MPTPPAPGTVPYAPNTVVYLCAGTGLDMQNSVWMGKYAYGNPYGSKDASWSNALFQFLKSHSIAGGYWYMTDIRQQNRYITVGRTPLQSDLQWFDENLGSPAKQEELNNPKIPYMECIKAVDYLIFVNGNGEETYQVTYAFVDRIDYVNQNTARVWYTIDALTTYQLYFGLNRCMVARDMQHNERLTSPTGLMYQPNLNYLPEPFEPDDSMYIFQHCGGETEAMEAFDLGSYNAQFVMSDVRLTAEKITSNQWISGIPAFEPANSVTMITDFRVGTGTKNRTTKLGLGLNYVQKNARPEDITAFVKLGQFNAFEHLLYVYSVPEKICDIDWLEGQCEGGLAEIIYSQYAENNQKYYDKDYYLAFPNYYDDTTELALHDDGYADLQTAYTPLNIKTHFAPYNYYAIADKQGNSLEIKPQAINSVSADDSSLYRFPVTLQLTAMPNMMSALFVRNLEQVEGSLYKPLLTLWQVPSYAMTPNNSGYMLDNISASANFVLGTVTTVVGVAGGLAVGAAGVAGQIGAMTAGAAIGGSAGALMAAELSGQANAQTQVASTATSTIMSYGINSLLKAGQNLIAAQQGKIYGLPKAMGGIPNGKSMFTLLNPGYEVYRIHLKQSLMKVVDQFFTVYGYTQNQFRYPHINTRRRWCYVKLDSVNTFPNTANTYPRSGVPTEMMQQIEDRLKAGVTFWNIRRQLMGSDDDHGEIGEINYNDPRITACNKCKFIKNYGNAPDSEEAIDNMSYTGGYASDYSDDYEIPLPND